MSRAAKNRRFRLLPVFFLTLLVSGNAMAQNEEPDREGYFEIRSAESELVDGVHVLDARMQLVLSSEALRALSSGFVLTIELQAELIRVRRW